ncbi:MAG: GNAT family N-acetyltransferase [Chitinophagaceae bacterium]|nr:GNAT family N-acetyltransferase [Chitinophagaceae bacterium]
MITVEKVNVPAIPLIRELAMKVWPQTYSSILTREQVDYMLEMIYSEASLQEQISEKGHQFVIAYDDKEPVAFASYSPLTEGDSRIFRLHKIYILPGQQGKGIGKKMLDDISADIIPLGAEILELNVNRYNPAKSFYEKIGFAVFREEDIDIGNGYFMNDYVMRKKL